MSVRQERVLNFQAWLLQHFGVNAGLTDRGLERTLKWAAKYAGLLYSHAKGFYTYKPAWAGDHIGANVLFDLSSFLGEFIISKCPGVTWAMEWSIESYPDAIKELDDETIKRWTKVSRGERSLKKESGAGFWRPLLVHSFNPLWYDKIQGSVFEYSMVMEQHISFSDFERDIGEPRSFRNERSGGLAGQICLAIREYNSLIK
jgi:hypothetical protein